MPTATAACMLDVAVPWMILVFAPLGVALVVLLTYAVGDLGDARLADEAAARARLAEQVPDFTAATVLLADGGRGALLAGGDEVALLIPLGDCFVGRVLARGDVLEVLSEETGSIVLRLDEATRPRLRLRFAAAAARAQALAWLTPLAATGRARSEARDAV